METLSSILFRKSWTEEPGASLQGLHRVEHDLLTKQ